MSGNYEIALMMAREDEARTAGGHVKIDAVLERARTYLGFLQGNTTPKTAATPESSVLPDIHMPLGPDHIPKPEGMQFVQGTTLVGDPAAGQSAGMASWKHNALAGKLSGVGASSDDAA